MKEKLIEFLELAEKASKFNPYTHENYLEHIEFYFRFLAIAPLTARKLMEAVELLERVKNDAWFNHLGYEIPREIKRFLEDFENEN
jgi:hypothetical protein